MSSSAGVTEVPGRQEPGRRRRRRDLLLLLLSEEEHLPGTNQVSGTGQRRMQQSHLKRKKPTHRHRVAVVCCWVYFERSWSQRDAQTGRTVAAPPAPREPPRKRASGRRAGRRRRRRPRQSGDRWLLETTS